MGKNHTANLIYLNRNGAVQYLAVTESALTFWDLSIQGVCVRVCVLGGGGAGSECLHMICRLY